MKQAGIPTDKQAFKERWRLALDLIDSTRTHCPVEVMLADAGYGSNRAFLGELDKRGIPFVAQTRRENKFWDGNIPVDERPRSPNGGRPRQHIQPADRRCSTKPVHQLAKTWFAKRDSIIKVKFNHKTPVLVEIVAKRVYETVPNSCKPRVGPSRWLIVERLSDGTYQYYVSNLPANVSPKKMIRLAHQRYKVEQSYQQLKEELGLDHFEGRSWTGLHHHVALCFMAYDFLQILARKQGREKSPIAIDAGS